MEERKNEIKTTTAEQLRRLLMRSEEEISIKGGRRLRRGHLTLFEHIGFTLRKMIREGEIDEGHIISSPDRYTPHLQGTNRLYRLELWHGDAPTLEEATYYETNSGKTPLEVASRAVVPVREKERILENLVPGNYNSPEPLGRDVQLYRIVTN